MTIDVDIVDARITRDFRDELERVATDTADAVQPFAPFFWGPSLDGFHQLNLEDGLQESVCVARWSVSVI